MEAYELAFRMQTQVPDVIDVNRESKETLDAYGIGQQPTDAYGRRLPAGATA